jgi:hypothetical protein
LEAEAAEAEVEAEVGIGGRDSSGRTSEAEVMMATEGTANAEAVDVAEAEVAKADTAKVAEVEGCIGGGGMHQKCRNVSEEHGGGWSCQR